MSGRNWLTCLWPGLPGAWQGSFAGLAHALAFAVGLNGVLWLHYQTTEILVRPLIWLGWLAVGGYWAVLTIRQSRAPRTQIKPRIPQQDPILCAQDEYLRGNWFAAEAVCRDLLRSNPRDSEAQLLWACVCRAAGRLSEARKKLQQLTGWDEARRWAIEVDRELQLVAQREKRIEPAAEAGGPLAKMAAGGEAAPRAAA